MEMQQTQTSYNCWLFVEKMIPESTLNGYKETEKCISADLEMQNEILKVMALKEMREIASNLHKVSFYAFMGDETTDCSNHEQFVVCLRWVDDDLQVHEDFIFFL